MTDEGTHFYGDGCPEHPVDPSVDPACLDCHQLWSTEGVRGICAMWHRPPESTECGTCGGTGLVRVITQEPPDDDEITCRACGAPENAEQEASDGR